MKPKASSVLRAAGLPMTLTGVFTGVADAVPAPVPPDPIAPQFRIPAHLRYEDGPFGHQGAVLGHVAGVLHFQPIQPQQVIVQELGHEDFDDLDGRQHFVVQARARVGAGGGVGEDAHQLRVAVEQGRQRCR